MCPPLLSAFLRLQLSIYLSPLTTSIPRKCYFPQLPQPLKCCLALLSSCPQLPSSDLLSPKSPPKPPPGHLTHPLLFNKPSPAFHHSRPHHVFFTSRHLCSPKIRWESFRSPVKRTTALPHSPSHHWMFFQPLPSVLRVTGGLNLGKRVNFLPQQAGPSQVQTLLLKF